MAQTVCIMPLDTAISSNCKSVNIYCIQCSWTYYVIAGLMNRELITGEQPFLFQFTFCVVFIYTVRRSNTHWGIIVSISLCSVCCASSNSSSTGLSLCLVVLVQSCVAGLCQAESHHKREGFRQQDNTRVCATAPEWRLALSDRSRLTTIPGCIVEVKGKRTAWSCLWDAAPEVGPVFLTAASLWWKKSEFLGSCLVGLVLLNYVSRVL